MTRSLLFGVCSSGGSKGGQGGHQPPLKYDLPPPDIVYAPSAPTPDIVSAPP